MPTDSGYNLIDRHHGGGTRVIFLHRMAYKYHLGWWVLFTVYWGSRRYAGATLIKDFLEVWDQACTRQTKDWPPNVGQSVVNAGCGSTGARYRTHCGILSTGRRNQSNNLMRYLTLPSLKYSQAFA